MKKGKGRGEIEWVAQTDHKGKKYCITSNADRTKYFLYEIVGKEWTGIAAAKSPIRFDETIREREK